MSNIRKSGLFVTLALVLSAAALSVGFSEVDNYMKANAVIEKLGSKSQEEDMLSIVKANSSFAGVVKRGDQYVVLRKSSGLLSQQSYNLSRMVSSAVRSEKVSFSDQENVIYNFKQLYDIRSTVVFSDLVAYLSIVAIVPDKNKVIISFQSVYKSKEAELKKKIEALNIPNDSYEIEWSTMKLANPGTTPSPTPSPPPPTLTSLRNGNLRPVSSGAGLTIGNFGGCSFGLYATRSGVPGFITAGHCYAQPSAWNTPQRLPIYAGRSDGGVIGAQIGTVETVPNPINACLAQNGQTYTNVYCIYTDSIFATFSPGVSYYAGLGLYNTNGVNNINVTPGQILQANPPLGGAVTPGTAINTIGSTTGTNQAVVTGYAVTIDSTSFDKALVIEHQFSANITSGPGIQGGDSGGGAFVSGNLTYYAAGVISGKDGMTVQIADISAIKSFHGLD